MVNTNYKYSGSWVTFIKNLHCSSGFAFAILILTRFFTDLSVSPPRTILKDFLSPEHGLSLKKVIGRSNQRILEVDRLFKTLTYLS